jgi:hypothetical protein
MKPGRNEKVAEPAVLADAAVMAAEPVAVVADAVAMVAAVADAAAIVVIAAVVADAAATAADATGKFFFGSLTSYQMAPSIGNRNGLRRSALIQWALGYFWVWAFLKFRRLQYVPGLLW